VEKSISEPAPSPASILSPIPDRIPIASRIPVACRNYDGFMASSISSSPVMIRCKGILFDMDGILISSIGSVERSWTKWAHLRGVDPALARATAHGRRAVETIAELRPDLDNGNELKVIEDIEIADNEGLTVLPGVLDLLTALPPDRWTIVTSATERLARVRMAAGGVPAPKRFVTAENVTRGKPDPEPFLAGATLLGFAPADCVVFEDSSSGAKAGRAAGCTVVATIFSHSAESLDAAHYVLRDLTGVRVESAGDQLVLHFTPLATAVTKN
jgi:mannitol-1-/sugar-/sorbitol-6-phosphatase